MGFTVVIGRALYLREKDRTLNALAYPKLFYPEIYVLEGGYSSFFQEYKVLSAYLDLYDDID